MGIGSSDGVRTDVDGNLWSGACWGGEGYDGVHCFAPDGTLIGQDPPARALRQPLLRRREKEPAIHNLFAVAVLGVRRDERGAEAVGDYAELAASKLTKVQTPVYPSYPSESRMRCTESESSVLAAYPRDICKR